MHQYPTSLSSSFTATPTKAITRPTCVLPTLDLAHASSRAFKMVSVVFCAGRLILLAQTHTNHHTSRRDGKIKSSSYNIFSFNGTVLPCNILADCLMQRRRKQGAMAVVRRRRPSWSVGAWFSQLSPRYLVCQVSAVKQILSLQSVFNSYVDFGSETYRACLYGQDQGSQMHHKRAISLPKKNM